MSGRSCSFDVSSAINPGTEALINIKQNSSGKFEFGPFSKEDIIRDKEVPVSMFDAREMMNGIKIQIWKAEQGQIGASMVLSDAKDPQRLSSTGTKHYRDQDRVSLKDCLTWIRPNAVKPVGPISKAVSETAA